MTRLNIEVAIFLSIMLCGLSIAIAWGEGMGYVGGLVLVHAASFVTNLDNLK